MIQRLRIHGLDCTCATASPHRIAYLLYPMEAASRWLDRLASEKDVTIVAISGMDWQNALSPWPAKGVPRGTPDFEGHAPQLLATLHQHILPQVESTLGIDAQAERTLVGVSMSGLFTLWQWLLCDTFCNIASLSGSFWYEGFLDWFMSHGIPPKKGTAYFLLGRKEPHSPIREFNSVGLNTDMIVSALRSAGIPSVYDIVPGDHYADPLGRLTAAFNALYT